MSESEVKTPRIALLGIPIEIGASQRGTLMGPDALRTAGIGRVLEQLGFAVEDHGNLAIAAAVIRRRAAAGQCQILRRDQNLDSRAQRTRFLLARSGAIPMFMGGDHSLSMGSVNGVARYWQQQGRPLFVLWLDAHADYNTPDTTETGNMHGMSAAFLCGEPGLDGLLGDQPRVSDRHRSARSVRHPLDRSAWKSSWSATAASRSPTCARSTNSASAS